MLFLFVYYSSLETWGKTVDYKIGMGIRERLFNIIEKDNSNSFISKVYDVVMLFLIIASIIPLMFRSQNLFFVWVDRITVTAFIIDYLCRWITADYKFPKRNKVVAFITYPLSFMAISDLLSILPSLGIFNKGLKALRVMRISKAVRILRLLRYSPKTQTFLYVLKKERTVLLSVLGIAAFYIFVTALVMFNVENGNQSTDGTEKFDNFFDAIYWATSTLTTVGYGDIHPISDFGRIVSMISALFGIAIIALPSGVITASYLDEIKKQKNETDNQ